uniref:Serine/threonine-protein phosphatase BSL2-like n=1 Tax=Nicotiana tabacum TaxID=4097 RepID=A0A1S4CGQ1_TOBAC
MDVDSTMSSESDHDQNNGASSEQLNGQSSAGGSPPETPQDQQHPATSQQQQQQGSTPVAGPRCAPTYSVAHAVLEKKEDGPGPRCGHTLTAVPAVGEEGSPNYIGPRLILFGGATALEGNSAAPGTPSSAGSAGIRLAGATADVHCYDVLTNKWSRMTPIGEPPTPRAAHVATAVGTM